MLLEPTIALARPAHAQTIAALSRDFIEYGVGWRWTPQRVLEMIRAKDVNVAVASRLESLLGFGIMQYKDDEAHLVLLGVVPAHQRKGIGAALVRWLEAAALTAGTGCVYVEARASNVAGRALYRHLGYREIKLEPKMYGQREAGVRLAKDLWESPAP